MNRPSLILLSLFATLPLASAAPRIALVRVTDIYRQLESTKTMQAEIEKERKAIMEDQRATGLKTMLEELKTLQQQFAEKSEKLDEIERTQLAQSYEIKAQEAQNMQQELERYHAERTKEINQKLVTTMRASLTNIHEISKKTASEQGFDMVIDSSGETNSSVPFVLYAKSPTDLTENVVAILQDAQASVSPPSPVVPDPTPAPEPPVPEATPPPQPPNP